MEGHVGVDVLLDRFRGDHPVELQFERREAFLIDPCSGKRCCRGLQHPPHRVELEHDVVPHHVSCEASRLQQEIGLEAGDISAVALPHLQHPDHRQGPDGLPERVAGEAEARGQLRLRGQPGAGAPLAGDDQLPDLVDGVVGDAT